jgi:hypothetical protein
MERNLSGAKSVPVDVRVSRGGLPVLVLILLGFASLSATARGPVKDSPVKSRPNWRLVSSGIGSIAADGRHVLLVPAAFDGAPSGILIDGQTGARRSVAVPRCGFIAIGGPWLLLGCAQRLVLYSLVDGRPRAAPDNPDLRTCPGGPCSETPTGVGRYWIEWLQSFGAGPCCVFNKYRYENISTGQMTDDPTTATMVPDLNRPLLARKVCSPLRTPSSYNDHAHGLGSLTFDGSFAVARSLLPPNPNGLFRNDSSGQETFLERCGTGLHERIGNDAHFTSHAVIWQASGGP